MDTFLIDVPMPSMGATVNELTVVSLKIEPGAHVAKGEKMGELESDKSIFEFESPCEGTVRAIHAQPGDARPSGSLFLQIETSDSSLQHLTSKTGSVCGADGARSEGRGCSERQGRPRLRRRRASTRPISRTSREPAPEGACPATTCFATSRKSAK